MSGRNIRFASITALGVALALSAPTTEASVIYQDSFNRVGLLDGSAPDIRPGSETWTAFDEVGATTPQTDGSVLTLEAARRNMFLPFVPQPGNVYQVSVDVKLDPASTSGDWHAIGFQRDMTGWSDARSFAFGLDPEGGFPWLLIRNNGAAVFFGGPGTQNNKGGPGTGTFASDVFHTLTVELDTTGASWVASGFINGIQIGDSHTFASNPSIMNVGLNAGGGSGYSYTFDNFVLVPEPASLALLGLGGLMLLSRRHDR